MARRGRKESGRGYLKSNGSTEERETKEICEKARGIRSESEIEIPATLVCKDVHPLQRFRLVAFPFSGSCRSKPSCPYARKGKTTIGISPRKRKKRKDRDGEQTDRTHSHEVAGKPQQHRRKQEGKGRGENQTTKTKEGQERRQRKARKQEENSNTEHCGYGDCNRLHLLVSVVTVNTKRTLIVSRR